MNWFAVTVIVLQAAAAGQYALRGQWSDAAIWLMYGAINTVLVWRAVC